MRVIVDAQRRAILKDHAPRAFNLDREQVKWILEPADFKFLSIKRAGLNCGSVVVRHELPLVVAATDPRTLVWKCSDPGLWPAATRSRGRR